MNIIDALVVKLTLDSSQFERAQKAATDSFDKTRTGAQKAAKTIEESGKGAAEAISRVTREVMTLFAVFTAGRGLKEFVASITVADSALGRLSANLKLAPSTVSSWAQAVEQIGGSGDAAAKSFQSFSDAIQELKTTGNTSILQFLYRLQAAGGTQINLNKSIDQSFLDLSANLSAINKRDPALANYLGRQLHLDTETISLLVKGPAAVREALAQASKNAVSARDTEAAQRLLATWVQMRQTAERFTRNLVTELTPGLVILLRQFQEWIEKNQEWITTNIVEGVHQLADWLKAIDWESVSKGIGEFAKGASAAADAVGGVAEATKLFFELWLGAKFLSLLANLNLLRMGLGLPAIGPLLGGGAAVLGMSTMAGDVAGGPDGGPGKWSREHGGSVSGWWRRNMPSWLGGDGGSRSASLGRGGPPNQAFTTAYNLIKKAGGTDEEARTMAAISVAESRGNPRAHNGTYPDDSYGLWQINMLGGMGPERRARFGLKSNEDLYDPETNARVALALKRARRGYGDWSTYRDGKYLAFLYSPPAPAVTGTSSDGSPVDKMWADRKKFDYGGGSPSKKPDAGGRSPFGGLDISRRYGMYGAPWAAGTQNNSSTVNNSSATTNIGTITVNTQATDASAIARDLRPAITQNAYAFQVNTGAD